MSPELWRKAEDLFHSALERSPETRQAFIEEACGADTALRRQVELLISQEKRAGSFLETPAIEDATATLTVMHPLLGRQIGPYRIVAPIGAGGMGEVYRAHDSKLGHAKRGGDAVRVPLDEALLGARARGIEMLALNQALELLSKIDARKARVVELRYFGGLSVEETAEVLGISSETVKRDWKMAKAWLFNELDPRTEPI